MKEIELAYLKKSINEVCVVKEFAFFSFIKIYKIIECKFFCYNFKNLEHSFVIFSITCYNATTATDRDYNEVYNIYDL